MGILTFDSTWGLYSGCSTVCFLHFSIEAFQIERLEQGGTFVLTNSSEEYTVDQEPWYIDRSANHSPL